MTNNFVKIDKTFLDEQVLLSTVMMELVIERSKSFYKGLQLEMMKLEYGNINEASIKAIQARLRNQREIELMNGMQQIANQMSITFDYLEAIDFFEEYLIEKGEIDLVDLNTEVKLAVIETSTKGFIEKEFDSKKLDAILSATKSFGSNSNLRYIKEDPFILDSKEIAYLNSLTENDFPIKEIISNNKPVLSQPRGQLRSVK